jgi:6-phosphogluconolactonase
MSKLIAYVGRNHIGDFSGGGISVFEVSKDGTKITPLEGGSVDFPKRAGFLAYAPKSATLYAVDERKTDGRGPKRPTSTVSSFRVDKATGALTLLNKQQAIGANPASVCVGPEEKTLFTANHGFFDHVIKVVETEDGRWVNSFVYDDSTVVQYPLNADGSIGEATDVDRLGGHGKDPNSSPQGGGHAQASPHAHIVVVDPSGKFLVVCEKAGERIYVYRLGGDKLVLASIYQCPLGTGPRHAAFDKNTGRMFMTCEFSSELWSFDFDTESGVLKFIDKQSTLSGFTGRNECATLQIFPNGKFVYMNNRGEDTVVWFSISPEGKLKKCGKVEVSKCPSDPANATRCMTLSPDGAFLMVPDRPADVIRTYACNPDTGALTALTELPVQNPVFIQFAEL